MKQRFFIYIVIAAVIGAVFSAGFGSVDKSACQLFASSDEEETGYGPSEEPTEFC